MNTTTNTTPCTFESMGIPKVSASALLDRDIAPTAHIVEGMLTAGVTLLCGAPNSMKSALALQLASAVASGVRFLGRSTMRGPVLYIESNEPVRQQRVNTYAAEDVEGIKFVDFNEFARLGSELEPVLDAEISQYGYRLVIIDSLVRIAAESKGDFDYTADARIVEKLVHVANKHPQTSILVLHHAREARAGNVLDAMYGSRGLTATVDGVLNLERNGVLEANQATHTLTGGCRRLPDLPPQALRAEGVKFTFLEEVRCHSWFDFIFETLRHTGTPMSVAQIARQTGENPAFIRKTCRRLSIVGRLQKDGALYSIPATTMTLRLGMGAE